MQLTRIYILEFGQNLQASLGWEGIGKKETFAVMIALLQVLMEKQPELEKIPPA